MKKDIKPCPFCGGNNLSFKYQINYGHGDSGFSMARIECNDCSGAKGNRSDYGRPTDDDERKAWDIWNERD